SIRRATAALGQKPETLTGWMKESIMNLESQWTVYCTRFLVRARQLTEPLVFTDALGREQSGQPGDYLVESSAGIRRITTQALFEDIYLPLAPMQLHPPAPQFQTRVQPAVHTGGVHADGAPGILNRPVTRASPPDRIRATA
ncbi:MAG TPA: hypothetical protein VKD23_04155, partial [Terriglobales bacterium]|nr:hypothetical protein [Terriglobales bacterium]